MSVSLDRCSTNVPAALADLLLPLRCAGCGVAGVALCAGCDRSFRGLHRVRPPGLPPWPPVHALARYSGRARAALLAYKEGGRRDLERPLGTRVATAARAVLGGLAEGEEEAEPVRLVPVPSRGSAVRRRGRAHLARLARRVGRTLPGVTTTDCLRLGPGVRDSVGLDVERRFDNLRGGVLPRASRLPPPGTPVLLLDDVLTTGATVLNCSRALAAAGIPVTAVLVLASACRDP